MYEVVNTVCILEVHWLAIVLLRGQATIVMVVNKK